MNSVTELKNFLQEQNLFGLYTSGERPDMFETLTTPEGVNQQVGFSGFPYQAKWWISYNQYSDDFTFCVGHFNHDGNAISKETFASAIPNTYASKYDETKERKWTRDGDIYRLQPMVDPVVKIAILTIVPR
jgi:hypothetical protein